MLSLSLLSLFSLLSLSSAYSTTLTLSPTALPPPHPNPWQRLNHLATASSTRAQLLKHPKSDTSAAGDVPLFPRGYGGYSVSLQFGTPPQNLSFVMDTASSLVWFPCTDRYTCNSCDFVGVSYSNISIFVPGSSSSTKLIGCKNPKCKWIIPDAQCSDCGEHSSSCTESCPPYAIQYGSGFTTGLLLAESLILPDKTVYNFAVGCSVFSDRQPAGIAGFGRGPESLPAQLGLKRFSYCLLAHQLDDEPVSSQLVLNGDAASSSGAAVSYTEFRENPNSTNLAFRDYYYVLLRNITVGGVRVKVPYKFLVHDSDGNGGTIVDSGSTFTYMDSHVFDLVVKEFMNQVGTTYNRARDVEGKAGLSPCFDVSGSDKIDLPQITFHFKGGAVMELPLADYFSYVNDSVVCMTMVSGNPGEADVGSGPGPGPSIILGNYQQQNYYMEFDLENNRLGFHKQLCNEVN